jgi:hypothetical protein
MVIWGRSPLATVARGLVAGVLGTAAMTVHQELLARRQPGRRPLGERSWDEAPAPAVVAKRLIEGLFGREVPARWIPALTHAGHWLYGTTLGVPYAIVAESVEAPALRAGVTFGVSAWALSYVQLVPMGLYEPPWRYPPRTIATDVGYHLTYGTATALAHRALGPPSR